MAKKKVYDIKITTSKHKIRIHHAIMAKIDINKKHITYALFHEKGGYRSYGYIKDNTSTKEWKYYSGRKKMMKDLLDYIKDAVEVK